MFLEVLILVFRFAWYYIHVEQSATTREALIPHH